MMKYLAFLSLLSLAAAKDGSSGIALRAKTLSYSASHQRRELGFTSWWYTLLNHLHVPCPHGHTEQHPLGHCANHAHKKSGGGGSHSSSGGSGGGGSSYYCHYSCDDCDGSSDCSCFKCEDVCQETCDGSSSSTCIVCGSYPTCSDDCEEGDGSGCVSCSAGYSPEGWTGDEWTDTTDSSWGGDAWQASYSKQNNGSSGKAAFWGIGAALCALVAGAALFMTKKRNESDVQEREVPLDVYMREPSQDDETRHYAPKALFVDEDQDSKTVVTLASSKKSVRKIFNFGRKTSKRSDGALI